MSMDPAARPAKTMLRPLVMRLDMSVISSVVPRLRATATLTIDRNHIERKCRMALESIRNRYRPRIPTITHVIELVGKEPRRKGLCAVRPFTHPDLAARRISTSYFTAHRSLFRHELSMTWVTVLAARAIGPRFPTPASSSGKCEPARVRRAE